MGKENGNGRDGNGSAQFEVDELLFGEGCVKTTLEFTRAGARIKDTFGNWKHLTQEELRRYFPQIEASAQQQYIEHLGDS